MTIQITILVLAVIALGFWVYALKKKYEKLKSVSNQGVQAAEMIPSEEEKERRKREVAVLAYINASGKITNDEAQRLLNVSDATATRYLQQLEDKGLIVQKGETGKAVYYDLK